jgi:hypothetical protein
MAIRNVLSVQPSTTIRDLQPNVGATANCNLFSTQEEAMSFGKKILETGRNWNVSVGLVPIFSDHTAATVPEVGGGVA